MVAGDRTQRGTRYISIDGARNLRDVGGYRTFDGRRTRWRTLLRSDNLHHLSDPAVAALTRRYGVRTVIDLRRGDEDPSAPHAWSGRQNVRYVSIALIGENARLPYETGSLDGMYRQILDQRKAQIGEAFATLLDPSAGGFPAVIHCTAGKDRTGLMVGLLLSAVGVPDGIVADDFALSGPRLEAMGFEVVVKTIAERRGIPVEQVRAVMGSPRTLMLDTLGYLNERYGGPVAYLQAAAGVPAGSLVRLRELLLEADT